MNKDVIYIEPEDDITDIISRIKSSKQKVVALIPPKKLGIMRSAVNIKLIAKTAKAGDKAVVVVTTDPSLVKLSAFSGLPVAKTLNSRPMLPSEFTKRKKQETEELAEKDLDMPAEDDSNAEEIIDEKSKKKAEKDDVELDSDDVEEDKNKKKKKSKKDNKLTEKIPNFDKYRKWILIGGGVGIVLIAFLIWAFGFAPYAKITVNMKTVSSNISENVTLVTDQKNVDNKAGKFLLEQLKYEDESSVEFEATGKANKGEKAKGSVFVIAKFTTAGSVNVPAGTTFTYSGKKYTSNTATSFKWDGLGDSSCENASTFLKDGYCKKSGKIDVTASEGGTSYNISSASSGWTSSISGVSVYSSTDMTGGTDKNVTVVSEADINDAKSQLANNSEAKEKLYAQIGDSVVKIESSYNVETKDPVSSPKKGEEVEDGKKAKLTAKTTYTIYVVDRTAIDEYVNAFEADKLGEHDRIYSTGNPFFERFLEGTDGTYTAKFKTTIKYGPEISESSILETAKGKKVGEVKALVKDISSNINDVTIEVSFPWVRSVPNDSNKVEVKIEVEE
ncbi:hypothetical protein IJ768_01980 [Candidatus Saccharibacteria bacterium]|nr:hypothetical protein [Candidatus Saccharibacteria bacterium]